MKNNNSQMLSRAVKLSLPLLSALFLLSIFWYGMRALRDPNFMPLRHVSISINAKNTPLPDLKKIILSNVSGGFFSFDANKLQTALAQLPWVNDVAIRRVWPDTISVTIHERQPILLWGDDGVVDNHDNLFFPAQATLPLGLARVFGPQEQLQIIVAQYQALAAISKAQHLEIKSLTLSERGAWQLQLMNNIKVILGRQNIIQRYQRFVTLYPKIIGDRFSEAKTVDLRYPNGVAISWHNNSKKSA